MLTYPDINPIFLQIGELKIHWYGLMYIVGFFSAWGLGRYRAKKSGSEWPPEEVNEIIYYAALGTILGGRLGYIVFYNLPYYWANPLNLFKIWDGGMSFHGGLIGVLIALSFFARRFKKSLFVVLDFVAPLVPLGLAAGRIGNFINGELWGRVTSVPWGMVFPLGGPLPRHPSQIYEFFLEGIILFLILWRFSSKPRPIMAVSGLFALCYGFFRFFLEFFREPDSQLGFLAWNWITMGQILSVPLIFVGIYFLFKAYRKKFL